MPLRDSPQSNRQHPVPQNIMDVEFKLVGDLTMRQFSYLLVLGFSAYFSFLIIPGIFKWPAVIILGLLALGLAFMPVQERGLDEWLVNFFRSINSPTQRTWRKEPQIPTAFLYDNLAVVRQEMITLAPTLSRRKLEEYLKYKTDSEVEDPLDIPEKAYAMKVRQAYPYTPKPVGVGVMVDGSVDYEKGDIIKEEIPEFKKKSDELPLAVSQEKEKEGQQTLEIDKKDDSSAVITKSRFAYGRTTDQSEVGSPVDAGGFVLPGRFTRSRVGHGYGAITPDMHSGRKFVNLVPSQGEIILPIRGERVLKTSEDFQIQDDLDEKARKLKDLLEKIRKEEGLSLPIKPSDKGDTDAGIDKQAQDVVEKMKGQNEDLASEIQRLKGQIERGKSMSLETSAQEQLLKKLEAQRSEIASSYSELRSQVQDLQKKLHEKEAVSTGAEFIKKVRSQVPVLTNKPNVVTGVVRDKEGNFLSDLLLIIRNSREDTVRAFKTNSLGQFVVSTPLQNGTYTVEVSPANKTDMTFGIIPIEVKGGIIPTLDIVGK